jgi:pimeloyl-ACP methyl ester carboxylesterase
VIWLCLGIAILLSLPVSFAAVVASLQFELRREYLPQLVRIFLEKPLFLVPRGQPLSDAEEVCFRNGAGQTLVGCYWRTAHRRKGVVLFGLEFGSNRWSCAAYCSALREAGYDVFAFEPRNQGDSDTDPTYEPLQWVTDRDVADVRAAVAYLKGRPDADPRGLGLFGVSKGGSAGLLAMADEPAVRCIVTDGAFATYTTMIPFMRKWFRIYNKNFRLHELFPTWYFGMVARAGLRHLERARGVHFEDLERALPRLAPRPWLQIHGGGDTYITPSMARTLNAKAEAPKEIWLVEKAKHNQALHLAGAEYHRRLVEFFDRHLAEQYPEPEPSSAEIAAEPVVSRTREVLEAVLRYVAGGRAQSSRG